MMYIMILFFNDVYDDTVCSPFANTIVDRVGEFIRKPTFCNSAVCSLS